MTQLILKEMNKEFLAKGKTLTAMVRWLNSEENTGFEKANGTKFTLGDVQSYIRNGHMPEYMGGNKIERDNKIVEVKIYNILK